VVGRKRRDHTRRNEYLMKELEGRSGLDISLVERGEDITVHEREWEMTKQDGSKQVCWMESLSSKKKDVSTGLGAMPPAQVMELAETKLKALRGACLKIEKGYWSYEFCYREGVFQFHGPNRQAADLVWSLGTYDASSPKLVSSVDKKNGGENQYLYMIHRFLGGQGCDETNQPRESQALFFCCPSVQDEGSPQDQYGTSEEGGSFHGMIKFESIEERELCNYTLSLCSPLLCEAGFRARGSEDAWIALRAISGLCFETTIDWWTYQFCVEKSIRQYHVSETSGENGQRKLHISNEYSLGTFVNDESKLLEELPKRMKKMKVQSKVESLLYIDNDATNPGIVQVYSNGSPCDITGQKRFTIVRYVCDKAANQVPNNILYVEEVSSCVYEVGFHSSLLCRHPLFAPKESKVQRLTCANS